MAYKLTVCRLGDEWAVRDATGELYGRSPVIDHTIEAAQRLSRRHGGRVIMSRKRKSISDRVHGKNPDSRTNLMIIVCGVISARSPGFCEWGRAKRYGMRVGGALGGWGSL